MRLLVKFNLVFVTVFSIGLTIAGFISHNLLQNNAREQVLQQARLMMEIAMSTRSYTTKQIAPLLQNQRYQLSAVLTQFEKSLSETPKAALSDASDELTLIQRQAVASSLEKAKRKAIEAMQAIPKDNPNETFHPQTVPAYAATENFNYLRGKYPEYHYKEATLNPTNLRDRAADWEADIVNTFRNSPETTEFIGTRSTPNGEALFLGRPIKITNASCLECHSTPDHAPPAMLKAYGPANGFGWKQDEIVGAQIVSVPMSLPVGMANHAFRTLLYSLIGVFLLTLAILNVVLTLTVIRPVIKLSQLADEVSKGKQDVEEFEVKGSDEISILATSFNRMQRSLVKAMKMLDE